MHRPFVQVRGRGAPPTRTNCFAGRRAFGALLLFLSLLAPCAAFADEGESNGTDMNWLVSGVLAVVAIYSMLYAHAEKTRSADKNHDHDERYSPVDHEHRDYVTREELRDSLSGNKEHIDLVRENDRRIDGKLDEVSKKISEGFSNVHSRIDPIAEKCTATAEKLDNHLNDHRAKKEPAHGN